MVESTQKLETGQLIWRQMIKTPLFNHYGVFVRYQGQDLVIHKNSTRKERVTTLDEFLHGYKLRGSRATPMVGKNAIEVLLKFEEMTDRQFNIFYDNCERFAHEVSGVKYTGREIDRALLISVAIIIAALSIKD